MTKLPAVIVDVDGTLVDVSGVRHYVMSDPRRKDFVHFHAGAALCPPIQSTIELLAALRPALRIIVVTSRKRQWEYSTRRWLRKWDVLYDELHVRADEDNRADALVKADILASLRERLDIVLAIDDNPSVLALWESEGIPTVVVPGWIYPTKPEEEQ